MKYKINNKEAKKLAELILQMCLDYRDGKLNDYSFRENIKGYGKMLTEEKICSICNNTGSIRTTGHEETECSNC